MTQVKIKRAYEKATASDGYRILVDRLWPRGIKKEELHDDLWAKDLAPSTELREWLHEDIENHWNSFVTKYNKELSQSDTLENILHTIKGKPIVTLLYGSKDEKHNQAIVLQEHLKELLAKQK